MEVSVWVIIGVVVAIPVLFIVGSMCSYVGKVWAIRLLFKKKKGEEDHNG